MSCDVTRDNFDSLLPRVLRSVRACDFAAFDTEFTALHVSGACVNSLFDTMQERYRKVKEGAQESVVCQVGLSLFRLSRDANAYEVETFNFFVFPRSFGPVDRVFAVQPSSIEFLVRHQFDFNKFIRSGVGYLNASQCRELRSSLSEDDGDGNGGSGGFFSATERNVTHEDEDAVGEACSKLAGWKEKKSTESDGDAGATTTVECHDVSEYLMHSEVRRRFRDLWTYPGDPPKTILVAKVDPKRRKELEAESGGDLTEDLIQDLRGFSKVIDALSEEGKALVGHNCFNDLVRIYQQFVDELPEEYVEFKRRLNRKFPQIFDTKQVSFVLRRQLELEESKVATALASTNLSDLMSSLSRRDVSFDPLYAPRIEHSADRSVFDKSYGDAKFHEAGFDAFCTGFCFVKMAHMAAAVNKTPALGTRPLNFREHLSAVSRYANQLNVGRGAVPYMTLDKDDPEGKRVKILVVRDKKGKKLDHVSMAERLARFGSLDAKSNPGSGSTEVLVATAGNKTADDVMRHLRAEGVYSVSEYSELRHGRAARAAKKLAGCVLVGVGCLLLAAVLFPPPTPPRPRTLQ